MRIWVGGALREPDEAVVSALDHGMTVGDGVFETLKTVGGRPFALDRHIGRLVRSARGLGLPAPDEDEVRAAVAAVTGQDAPPLGRLRITFTAGVSPLGSDRGDRAPTLIAAHEAATRRPDITAVVTVPWTRNETGALAGLKTTSYGENVLALARAREQGATEALFANTRGLLCEGTGSNVFVVTGGELLTPTLASGCLAGITRQLVADWCGARETDLPFDVLRTADEVFITSSLRDVQAVHRVDDREWAAPGPVTLRAVRTFADRAAEEVNP